MIDAVSARAARISLSLLATLSYSMLAIVTNASASAALSSSDAASAQFCSNNGGSNLGSYDGVFACTVSASQTNTDNPGKPRGYTVFDQYQGFQCTELANRYLWVATKGQVVFGDNLVGGNYVQYVAAKYTADKTGSHVNGVATGEPAVGDVLSMWNPAATSNPDLSQNGTDPNNDSHVGIVASVTATSITYLSQNDVAGNGNKGYNTIAVNGPVWHLRRGDYNYTNFQWLKIGKPAIGTTAPASVTRQSGSSAKKVTACRGAALFAAAVKKEGLNPNSPGYVQLSPAGDGPGAYGPRCADGWGIALVSRPSVGTTDGETLFRTNTSRTWVEVSQLGGQPTHCELIDAGVPVVAAKALISPDPAGPFLDGCSDYAPSLQPTSVAPMNLATAVHSWTSTAPTANGLFAGCSLYADIAEAEFGPSGPWIISFGGSSGVIQFTYWIATSTVSLTIDPPLSREPALRSERRQLYSSYGEIHFADGSTLQLGRYNQNSGLLTIKRQPCSIEVSALNGQTDLEQVVETLREISATTIK